jgi:hypothetical protein
MRDLTIPATTIICKAGEAGSSVGHERAFEITPNGHAYYLEYSVLFDSNFDFGMGGKLPGIGTDKATDGCHEPGKTWSVRLMWRRDGMGLSAYIYHMDNGGKLGCDRDAALRPDNWREGKYGDEIPFKIDIPLDTWIKLKIYVCLNNPGEANGVFKLWINDEIALEIFDIEYIDDHNCLASRVLHHVFHGGRTSEWAPKKDSTISISDVIFKEEISGNIVVVNKDRLECLDTTLKSLSATLLPINQKVVVCDDGSNQQTRNYLLTDNKIEVNHTWNFNKYSGLDTLPAVGVIDGVRGKVAVKHIPHQHTGVVKASCWSLKNNFEGDGIFLLQNDIVLTSDWYYRILHQSELCDHSALISGLRVGRGMSYAKITPRSYESTRPTDSLITAQCYFIPRKVYEAIEDELHKLSGMCEFDRKLLELIRQKGFETRVICPSVGQHTGVISMVKSRTEWMKDGCYGRVAVDFSGEYAIQDTVKRFEESKLPISEYRSWWDKWF